MQLILPQICWHLITETVPPVLQVNRDPPPPSAKPGSSWGNLLGALQQECPYGEAPRPATASKRHWGAAKSLFPPPQKMGPTASQNQTQFIYTSMQYPLCLYNLYSSIQKQDQRIAEGQRKSPCVSVKDTETKKHRN